MAGKYRIVALLSAFLLVSVVLSGCGKNKDSQISYHYADREILGHLSE